VKLIHISDMDVWRELGVVYRRDRTLPRAAVTFITMVRQGAPSAAENHAPHSHAPSHKR
jgi:hypothetical protein